jgi:multidrug transporter EmrE-like cation transporter
MAHIVKGAEAEDAFASWQANVLAPLLALLSCVLYCCNGELLQALQVRLDASQGHPSVLLNLTCCHLGGLLFIKQARWQPKTHTSGPSLTQLRVGALSLVFACLIMAYNYAFLCAARFLSLGLVNAIFQTSIGMVYVASVVLFAERLSVSRMLGVALCLAGTALAGGGSSLSLSAPEITGAGPGFLLSLLAAMGVTVYQVLFKLVFGHLKNDVGFLMHFGFWVSVWHVLVMGPLILLVDMVGFEELELPRSSLAIAGTLSSAVIASTVNALYLCIIMWGSPMLLPCASAFSVPLTVGLDAFLHGLQPGRMEALGHIVVVLAVALILDLPNVFRGPDAGQKSVLPASSKPPYSVVGAPASQ